MTSTEHPGHWLPRERIISLTFTHSLRVITKTESTASHWTQNLPVGPMILWAASSTSGMLSRLSFPRIPSQRESWRGTWTSTCNITTILSLDASSSSLTESRRKMMMTTRLNALDYRPQVLYSHMYISDWWSRLFNSFRNVFNILQISASIQCENLEYKLQGNFNTASPPSHSSDIPEVIQSAFYSPYFYFEWDDVTFRRRLYSIYYLRLAPVESILSSYAYVKWCSLFLAWVLLLRKRWTACTAFYLISSSHNPATKFPWNCMRRDWD